MSRTKFYELLACRRKRWDREGVALDKDEALEDARTLVERDPLVTAVRVMMIENGKDGITERPVRFITRASLRGAVPNTKPTPETDLVETAPSGSFAAASRTRVNPKRSWSNRERALTAAVVLAAVGLLCFGALLPKRQWAFDLPEAQRTHIVNW